MTLIPIKVYALILLALVMALGSRTANAEPVAKASAGNVVITFYNEPCELKEVTNLPYKTTWEEGGKTFQGCFGIRPDAGIVVAYFDDKTVSVIPLQALVKVTSL